MCNCKKNRNKPTPEPIPTPEEIVELTEEEIDYFNNIDILESIEDGE